MQHRKLINDMTIKEVALIRQCLGDIQNKKIKMTDHAKERSRKRKITEDEIIKCIKKGSIIEVHHKRRDVRVLLRSDSKNRSICVVVDVISERIVTVYTNGINDTHESLHKEIYDSEFDIESMILNYKR